jgi:hypothetical protein
MSYDARIRSGNPGYFIFLIDQSGSMEDPIAGAGSSKAISVATAINQLLNNLVVMSSRGNTVKDYFTVSIVAYGDNKVSTPWQGELSGSTFVTTSQLEANPARVDSQIQRVPDGIGGYREAQMSVPLYIDPVAAGGTPMCKALDNAFRLCEWWVGQHPDGFPPIVINLTDGEATDGDPLVNARRLAMLATSNGNVLLFNLHVSSGTDALQLYPATDTGLVDPFAQRLFAMSSHLPEPMINAAAGLGIPVAPEGRGFVFNADASHLVQFLQIGTNPSNLMSDPNR